MKVKDLVKDLGSMSLDELNEFIQKLRMSRSIPTTTRTKKRKSVSKMSKVDNMLRSLSDEDRKQLLKLLGGE